MKVTALIRSAVFVCAACTARLSAAQEPPRLVAALPAPASSPAQVRAQLDTRMHISVMEHALVVAVQRGAQGTGSLLQPITPQVMLFNTNPQARGFKLDGYGLFFFVEVPVLRNSVAWSFRELMKPDPEISRALQALRQHVRSEANSKARPELEEALRRVERQVEPVKVGSAVQMQAEATGRAPETVTAAAVADDPETAYTDEVKVALIDTMLDYSGGIPIAPSEWITVAARSSEGNLVPGEVFNSVTITLRLKGSDLAEFRAGRLTKAEARTRVEVREF